MESREKLNKNIETTLLLIQTKYPELITFLNELPAPFPESDNTEISSKDLQNYLNTLNELISRYSEEQKAIKQQKKT